MATGKTVTVKAEELRAAFEFVSAGSMFLASAYICLESGKIHWKSADLEDDDLPDDIEDSDRYLPVPGQHDLHLGRPLAMGFVAAELPDDYDTVHRFFSRRGAYARFKDLLVARGKLERWYEFENQATEDALRDWCADNGIQLAPGGPDG